MPNLSTGQVDFQNYTGLKSRGPVPEEFTRALTEKYQLAREELAVKDKSRKKIEAAFHLSSQHFIDDLMTSGRVTYGDPVTNYIQSVMDKVLEDYGATNKNIRVFTVKSPQFNAAATNDGIVFVNLGLMAQVENEAQLAFILAHEIIHSEENHVLEGFVEHARGAQNNDVVFDDGSSRELKLIALRNFSKSLEFEADREAFKRFMLRSGYDPFEAVRVMDVMLYAYLPFDEVPFSIDFFNHNFFKLPRNLTLDTINAVTAIEDYYDELSTHPNLRVRKDSILEMYNNQSVAAGKLFIVGETQFFEAQKAARFEISSGYLYNRQYPESIYNSYLLLREDPNNKYLRKTLGLALHTWSTYKNNKNTLFIGKTEKVEGNLQTVYHLLKEGTPLELNVLAAQYNYLVYKDFPDDAFAKKLFEMSFKELVFFHELKSDYFFKEVKGQEDETDGAAAAAEEEQETRRGRSSKVQTLKKQREFVTQTDSLRMAFAGEFDNPLFLASYKKVMADFQNARGDKNYLTLARQRYMAKKNNSVRNINKKKDSENSTKPTPLNIQKVVIVAPEFTVSSNKDNGKSTKSIKKGEERLASYRNAYVAMLDQAMVKSELLDYKSIDPMDEDGFNHLQFAKSWFIEYWKHPAEENIVSLVRDAAAFVETFKTPYILFTGAFSEPVSRKLAYRTVETSLALIGYPPLALPLFLNTVIPREKTIVYTLIFDVETGELKYRRFDAVDTGASTQIIDVINYANIQNIKTL